MKYWTSRHWNNWHEFVACLRSAVLPEEQAAPVRSDARPEVNNGEATLGKETAELDTSVSTSAIETSVSALPEAGVISEVDSASSAERITEDVTEPGTDGEQIASEPAGVLEQETEVSAERPNPTIDDLPSVSSSEEALEAPTAQGTEPSVLESASEPITEVIGGLFPDAGSSSHDGTKGEGEPEIDAEPSPTAPVAKSLSTQTNSGKFFSLIPWAGATADFSAPAPDAPADIENKEAVIPKGELAVPKLSKPRAFDLSVSAKNFFSALPWLEGSATSGLGDEEEVLRISVATHAKDHGSDVRSSEFPADNLLTAGLFSAAKTSDRVASSTEETPNLTTQSKRFFNLIPW